SLYNRVLVHLRFLLLKQFLNLLLAHVIVFIAKMANQFLPFVANLPEILGAKHSQCINKTIAAAAAKEIYGLAIQLLYVKWISGFNHNIVDILPVGKKMAD